MNSNLGLLIPILLGTGIATTGLLLLLSWQGGGRRISTALAGAGLVLLGSGLGLGAWLLGAQPAGHPADDFNRLLAHQPSAAGPPPRAGIHRLAVVVDGTPSDHDSASAEERHAYATALAARLAEAAEDAGLCRQAEGRAIIMDKGAGRAALPSCTRHDLLVMIRLPAVHLPNRDDYALWREPEFELLWCTSGQHSTHHYRVLERQGDTLPYEQALRSHLLELLRSARQNAPAAS